MMLMTIDLTEAEARFEELVERAESGEEIILLRDGAPVARLVAFDAERRSAGAGKTNENARGARN